MADGLFRKKSMEKISSPEQLDNYMRVAKPSTWIILFSILIFLIGVIFLAIFGKITTKVKGVCIDYAANNYSLCYVSDTYSKSLTNEMYVTVSDKDYKISWICDSASAAETVLDDYAMSLAGLKVGEFVREIRMAKIDKSGTYASSIVVETISAISFLWR